LESTHVRDGLPGRASLESKLAPADLRPGFEHGNQVFFLCQFYLHTVRVRDDPHYKDAERHTLHRLATVATAFITAERAGYYSSAKFFRIFSPCSWLFSGWNWVANRLSRHTMAQKGLW
jgi:hypothetical protein